MLTIDELTELKTLAEEKTKEKTRLEGQLQQLESQLNEMGFESIKDAKAALEELEKEKDKLLNDLDDLAKEIKGLLDNMEE